MTAKGQLICPKCQNFGMNKYLYYESKKNEDNKKIYVFYYTRILWMEMLDCFQFMRN